MKIFSMLQALYLSFFSRDLYRDVRTNWKGTGFLYLLLLLSITWLPVMARIHWALSDAIKHEAPQYIDQVPTITIKHGEVSIDRPVPYSISVPDSGTTLLVIDTSGTVTSFDQTTAMALLTRNKFMFRESNGNGTRIYDLSKIDDFTVDRDRANVWVQAFGKYFAPLTYPFALAASFAYRVLQMLLYAAIGLLMAKFLKAPLDYLVLIRLASVSITPVIIFSTLQMLTGFHVPAYWLFCFVIAMGYLFFAIKSNAEPVPPEAPVLEA